MTSLSTDPHDSWPSRPSHILAVVGIAIGIGFMVPGFAALIRTWGRHILESNVDVGYLLSMMWATVLAVVIVFLPVRIEDKPRLLLLWAVKIGVTLGVMLLYEYLYGLDAYWYSWAAQRPERPSEGMEGYRGGTGAILLLSWWLNKLGPESFHALKLSYSFIGLLGVYILYRAAGIARPVTPRLLYTLAFFPTVLFWSSTLGKDATVFFGIAIATLGSMGILRHRGWHYWIILGAGITLAAWIRTWLAPLLLAPVLWASFAGSWGWGRRLVAAGLTMIALVAARDQIIARAPSLSGRGVVDAVRTLSSDETSWKGGSARKLPRIESPGSLAAYVPVATFTGLFRPLPGEVLNPFGVLFGLENLLLVILLVLAIRRSRWRDVQDPVVQWAIVYLLGWGALHGLTVYNYGALVRFKLQASPVLLCLLLHLSQKRSRVEATIAPVR